MRTTADKPEHSMPTRTPGNTITVLALDPSSTLTGYALLRDDRPMRPTLLSAGLLKPKSQRDAPDSRIDVIVADLAGLIEECRPDVVVVEVSSGKVARRHGGGGGAGLAIYGQAVGEVRREAIRLVGRDRVASAKENDWTGGTPKGVRTARVVAAYNAYDPSRDTGGDVADAIGLGEWWLRIGRRREERKAKGATA